MSAADDVLVLSELARAGRREDFDDMYRISKLPGASREALDAAWASAVAAARRQR